MAVADRERKRAIEAAYRERHRERLKLRQAAPAARKLMYMRILAYRERHKEKLKLKRAAYYKRNKEMLAQRKRLSYAKHPVSMLMMTARRGAKMRGLTFQITRADLLPLPVECPVLGIPLNYAYGTKNRKTGPDSPSVDRRDNTKGYIPGNVVIISWRANRLKSDGTPEELMKVARYAKGNGELPWL